MMARGDGARPPIAYAVTVSFSVSFA
jgi:hypothetical protein